MHETPPARRRGSFYLPLKQCRKTAFPPRKNYIGYGENNVRHFLKNIGHYLKNI